jgi:hypothetical protein
MLDLELIVNAAGIFIHKSAVLTIEFTPPDSSN